MHIREEAVQRTVAILWILSATQWVAPAWGQPANDVCSSAIEVYEDTPVTGTNVGASGVDLSGCAGDQDANDVWYSFRATRDGLMTIRLCGSDFDTSLSVFDGCGGVELACNDDACNLQSTSTLAMSAERSYFIRIAGWNGAQGAIRLEVSASDVTPTGGPDVTYGDIDAIENWGAEAGVRGYSLGTATCNMGDRALQWGGSPVLAMNAYRLGNGRLEQIGMSWLKNATVASAGDGCGLPCTGGGGSILGPGCRDQYSADYNGGQYLLGPRSGVNAYTGSYQPATNGSGNATYRRLDIAEADLADAQALYFVEGQYVAPDDAAAGNALNNSSYKRVTVSGANKNLAPVEPMYVGEAAIYAWRDHGLGVDHPDPSVQIVEMDVPDEGRFLMAAKTTDLGGGRWRYDYAVRNLNSHRSADGLVVPIPAGAHVTAVGFHDVDYHSGEVYDNTDWRSAIGSAAVTWSSPQTFAQNVNTNALRWATMYNFWFEADAPPAAGLVTLSLFRPGTPESITAAVPVPTLGCTGRVGDLNADGRIDGADVRAMVECLQSGGACPCGDVDGSGGVTSTDVPAFVAALLAA